MIQSMSSTFYFGGIGGYILEANNSNPWRLIMNKDSGRSTFILYLHNLKKGITVHLKN